MSRRTAVLAVSTVLVFGAGRCSSGGKRGEAYWCEKGLPPRIHLPGPAPVLTPTPRFGRP